MLPFPQERGLGGRRGRGREVITFRKWIFTLTVSGRKEYYWKALEIASHLFQEGLHILKKLFAPCSKMSVSFWYLLRKAGQCWGGSVLGVVGSCHESQVTDLPGGGEHALLDARGRSQ